MIKDPWFGLCLSFKQAVFEKGAISSIPRCSCTPVSCGKWFSPRKHVPYLFHIYRIYMNIFTHVLVNWNHWASQANVLCAQRGIGRSSWRRWSRRPPSGDFRAIHGLFDIHIYAMYTYIYKYTYIYININIYVYMYVM